MHEPVLTQHERHTNDWPVAQHQRHASQEEERTSKFLSLEEEVGCPPEANDECQTSQKEDLQGEGSEQNMRGN